MKRNKNFLVHKTGGETVVVPTGNADFSGIVKGNKTLGAILDLMKNDTDEQQIIDAMAERFEAPRDVIEKDVANVIIKLRSIGAIDE